MLYQSTRGVGDRLTAGEAILKGMAGDGGLYVPEAFPDISAELPLLLKMPYRDMAKEILRLYLTDYTDEELRMAADRAYGTNFDVPGIAPLVKKGGYYFLELFHGPTLAFKDMALSVLPGLMKTAARRQGMTEKVVVLTATSGDTGKAALEGFANMDGIEIVVFYPIDGVSAMQKRQMQTQDGKNTHVIGVYGNFDDAQAGVKRIFREGIPGLFLSSANSINIGRLLPQIVYYIYAYAQMVDQYGLKAGDPVNYTVPTGNFGNILAGYYAKRMGLPVNRLICASNVNRVLYDFFQTSLYDRNRAFFTTASPSMDILVSSNLERLLYHLSDDTRTKEYMNQLSDAGSYRFTGDTNEFASAYANQDECFEGIREMYEDSGYIMDPHTSVAYKAYIKYRDGTGDHTPNIILSTASPFKFPENVCASINAQYAGLDAFEAVKVLQNLYGGYIPEQIASLEHKTIRHITVCSPDSMKDALISFN